DAAVEDRAMSDVPVLVDDRIGSRKAVHDATVLQVRSVLHHDAPEVAAQRRAGSDVAAGADDHVADQHGGGMDVGTRIDDGPDAVDRIDGEDCRLFAHRFTPFRLREHHGGAVDTAATVAHR